jgi:hypothetical protein
VLARGAPANDYLASTVKPKRRITSGPAAEAQVAGPQHIGQGSGADGQAGMIGIGMLHGVDRQGAQGVDAEVVELSERRGHEVLLRRFR